MRTLISRTTIVSPSRTVGAGLILLAVVLLLFSVPVLAGSQGQDLAAISGSRAGAAAQGLRESDFALGQKARPVAQAASVTVDLCAKAGTVTMPDGAVIDVWGLALKPAGVPCSDPSVVAQVPGPTLDVNQGDNLTLILHNELSQSVSLLFPGQGLIPDTVGAAPGGTTTYAFTASRPGTFLYESGANAATQVAMGLYGALIVRSPTAGQAYATAESAYDREALLVLGEIDPALNADPADFNLLDYAPYYWLINGAAYPDTDPIVVAAGERLLLRYLNAGLNQHTMTLLGLHQRVIAMDAYPRNFPFDSVAMTIPAGQTFDMVVAIPAGAADGTTYPLYNRQLRLTNGGVPTDTAHFPGGMMTFIEVQAGGPAPTPTPTNTPIPPTATNTPVGPTATNTPVPSTPTATATPVPVTTMHVGDLDGISSSVFFFWSAQVTISVHDQNHNPVANATVSGSWSAGANGSNSCTTDGTGQCTVSRFVDNASSSVTFTANNVTHASLTYQSADNHDPDGDSSGSAITVARP